MNSLEFIKQHVTEWPNDEARHVTLYQNGTIMFHKSTVLPPNHFVRTGVEDHQDGKVWSREEFEACGKQAVPSNKYERELTDRQGNSATIDVYDVLQAFNVTCPATQHAVKKLLCTGIRGHKDGNTDLLEARESITRAIELRG